MADRHKKGDPEGPGVDIGRRTVLRRLGFGLSVAYAAPALLGLNAAQAGVVVGDGDLDNHNDKGDYDAPGKSDEHRQDGEHASEIGKNRRKNPVGGGNRMTLQELLNYIANLSKQKK